MLFLNKTAFSIAKIILTAKVHILAIDTVILHSTIVLMIEGAIFGYCQCSFDTDLCVHRHLRGVRLESRSSG